MTLRQGKTVCAMCDKSIITVTPLPLLLDDYDFVEDIEDDVENSVYQPNSNSGNSGSYEDATVYQARREEQPSCAQFESTSHVQREDPNTEQESRGRSVQFFAPCLSSPLIIIADLGSIGVLDWIRETQNTVSTLMKL
jgi:hypothetical protein